MGDEPAEGTSAQIQRVSQALHGYINAHGEGFEAAVAAHAEEVCGEVSGWEVIGAEHPFSVGAAEGSIDLVLWSENAHAVMAIECKRANAKTSHWCFCAAPARKPKRPYAILETLTYDDSGHMGAAGRRWGHLKFPVHHGFEVRTGTAGEPFGAPDVLEKGVAQAVRGASGLIELFARHESWLSQSREVLAFPVLVTTAQLFTSTVDLAKTRLTDGKLPSETEISLKSVPWVGLQRNIGAGLRHTIRALRRPKRFDEYLEFDTTRTVFVSTPEGLRDLLIWAIQGRI
ncbi:MAG: hypothetical protein ACT4P7_01190 [Gemmatimonadaceae bacterium]